MVFHRHPSETLATANSHPAWRSTLVNLRAAPLGCRQPPRDPRRQRSRAFDSPDKSSFADIISLLSARMRERNGEPPIFRHASLTRPPMTWIAKRALGLHFEVLEQKPRGSE
jgi:hypothetical protein